MPLEEKYEKMLDYYTQHMATTLSLVSELGLKDAYVDLSTNIEKKMLPGFIGMTAFKMLRTIAPGRAFNQVSEQFAHQMQRTHEFSNIKLEKVSDREVNIRLTNCPFIKRMRNIIDKADLDITPRLMCEIESEIIPKISREFGTDLTINLVENGCVFNAKLL